MALDNMASTALLPVLGENVGASLSYVRFSSVQEYSGEFFQGRLLLNAVNRALSPDRKLSQNDKIGVTRSLQLRLMGRLLLQQQASITVRGYAAIMLARYLAPLSSKALTRVQLSEYGRDIRAILLSMGGCVTLAAERFSYATGDMLARWFFPPDKTAGVRSIASRVFNATHTGWIKLGWTDDATRQQGLRQLGSFHTVLGRPQSLSTLAQLDSLYSYLPVLRGSFTEMLLSAERSRAILATRLLGTSRPTFLPVRSQLPMIVANAFYVPTQHSIVVPPALLFAPFFDLRAPAPMNYGSLGHVIGHEVTHGFDPEFGGDEWWSERSRSAFRARLACLQQLYNNVSLASTGIRFGDTAKEENFADAGGMRKALDAFKTLEPQSAERLGKRVYFADQLFFISSCHKWCSEETRESSVLSEGVKRRYSPPQMRCNVPLMNTWEFSQAFGCLDESHMKLRKTCDIF
ncbi:neprilysin-1-like [Dermacentor silvarum]|uniref:neprilysin-1-like n=1 Tax=Dermacentor silvarum TaxID=543639 RepID=UPI00189AA13A|nr:neprilysin-1-like [Dermacentor silvarum]